MPSDTSPMRLRNFYPRPPRGGRPSPARSIPSTSLFLSTPSARRATREVAKAVYDDGISIHALREEGDAAARWSIRSWSISIHALREEGDVRRTYLWERNEISIHALREEGDECPRTSGTCIHHFYPRPPRGGRPPFPDRPVGYLINFYPRPPRGGRRLAGLIFSLFFRFLSTPSARRATKQEVTT